MPKSTTTARNHVARRLVYCAIFAACGLAGCGGKKDEPKKSTGTSSTSKTTDTARAKTKNAASAKKTPEASGPAEWGTLKGRFVYDGKVPEPLVFAVTGGDMAVCCSSGCPKDNSLVVGQDGGLANVAVYLRTEKGDKVPIHPDYEKDASGQSELNNKGCMFEPHLVVMRTSQTLIIKNSDPIGHNTNVQPISSPAKSEMIPVGGNTKYNFKKAEAMPVPAVCNIHPWMKGYVLARDDPYATKTAEDGTFELKNLPAGSELEFQLWHERCGYLSDVDVAGKPAKRGRFTIKLKPGENDLGEIKVPSDKLTGK